MPLAPAETLVVEEHAQVLPLWWARGVRGATLLCFDAHLDLQPLAPTALASLRDARDEAAVAALAAPHPLWPASPNVAYGIDSFLGAAHSLGLIERVVWVAPPHVDLEATEAVLEPVTRMRGVTVDELASFRRAPGGWLEGRLLGVPLTIARLQHLPALELPRESLVDVDADYFLAVPDDVPWTGPRELRAALAALDLAPPLATVTRSVRSGFLPLRYRFLADATAAGWRGDDDEAARLDRLLDLAAALRAGEDVGADLRTETERHTHCAATACLHAEAQTGTARAEARDRAAELDPAYADDLLRDAHGLHARQQPVAAVDLERLETRLADEPDADRRALTHVALGMLSCQLERRDRGAAHYEGAAARFGGHPELAVELATVLLAPQPAAAAQLLSGAVDDAQVGPMALFLRGVARARMRSWLEAGQDLAAAHDAAPAWTEPLAAWLEVCEQAGDAAGAEAARRRHEALEDRLAQLAARLQG